MFYKNSQLQSSRKTRNNKGQTATEYALTVVIVVMLAAYLHFLLLPYGLDFRSINLAAEVEKNVYYSNSRTPTILEKIFRNAEETIIAPGP